MPSDERHQRVIALLDWRGKKLFQAISRKGPAAWKRGTQGIGVNILTTPSSHIPVSAGAAPRPNPIRSHRVMERPQMLKCPQTSAWRHRLEGNEWRVQASAFWALVHGFAITKHSPWHPGVTLDSPFPLLSWVQIQFFHKESRCSGFLPPSTWPSPAFSPSELTTGMKRQLSFNSCTSSYYSYIIPKQQRALFYMFYTYDKIKNILLISNLLILHTFCYIST